MTRMWHRVWCVKSVTSAPIQNKWAIKLIVFPDARSADSIPTTINCVHSKLIKRLLWSHPYCDHNKHVAAILYLGQHKVQPSALIINTTQTRDILNSLIVSFFFFAAWTFPSINVLQLLALFCLLFAFCCVRVRVCVILVVAIGVKISIPICVASGHDNCSLFV